MTNKEELQVEGIDLEELRYSLELDDKEISNILLKYANTYENFHLDIKNLEIDSEEFRFLLHKLKGVTASLRIKELPELILNIEKSDDKKFKEEKTKEFLLKLEKTISLIKTTVHIHSIEKISNDELIKSIDSLIFDIKNYNFIKQDRINIIINSLEGIISKEKLDELLSSFTKNKHDEVKQIITYIKGCINV